MEVPGSNLLSIALSVIAAQTVRYYAYNARTILPDGTWSCTYADGIDVDDCSVQVVDSGLYNELGLDYQKRYKWLFTFGSVNDLERDTAGDRFGFAGRKYQMQSSSEWESIDGWRAVLCVDIGLDNGVGGDE